MSRSLLQGGLCSDVTIAAFGRLYKLHKVVLVQSGFFNAMFCGGFSEAEQRADSLASDGIELAPHRQAGSGHATSSSSANRFDVHFPDPNMSRPAFEFCIATLYGSAPTLRLPGWANPKAQAPLGSGFPVPVGHAHQRRGTDSTLQRDADARKRMGKSAGRNGKESADGKDATKQKGRKAKGSTANFDAFDISFASGLGAGVERPARESASAPHRGRTDETAQWATPRFLLSLIATSTYLGVPSVTSLALTLILGSITPYTVSAYMRFASGLGIVEPSSMHQDSPASISNSTSLPSDELEGCLVGWERLSAPDAAASPTSSANAEADQQRRPSTRAWSTARGSSARRSHDAGGSPTTMTPRRGSTPPPMQRLDTAASSSTYSLETGGAEDGGSAQLFYGPSCNKIGEACVCWLGRWGGDVLDWEIGLCEGSAAGAKRADSVDESKSSFSGGRAGEDSEEEGSDADSEGGFAHAHSATTVLPDVSRSDDRG